MSQPLSARQQFCLQIDFDSTLFDTARFADDLWRDIGSRVGLTAEQVGRDSKQFEAHATFGGYDFTSHVRSYGLEPGLMWRRLQQLFEADDYVFNDSVEFIGSLLDDGYQPNILSFGDKRYQELRIIPTLQRLRGNRTQDLNFTVVSRTKGEHITETYPDQVGALVDNLPDQHLPASFSEIHLDRFSSFDEPQPKVGGYTVSNLCQARQVIDQLVEQKRHQRVEK
jgi:haloacid dehalogenase-like hydrolase